MDRKTYILEQISNKFVNRQGKGLHQKHQLIDTLGFAPTYMEAGHSKLKCRHSLMTLEHRGDD